MPKFKNKSFLVSALLWCLVALWMAVIFMFSAQIGAESANLSGGFTRFLAKLFVDGFESMEAFAQADVIASFAYPIRKLAHFSEYLVLSALCFFAVKSHGKSSKLSSVIAVAISFLYAVSDEIHQYFVPDRACRFTDVLIDTSGAVTGIILCCFALFLTAKLRNRKRVAKAQ